MEIEQARTALAALAQKGRLAAFRLLVQAGPTGLVAGELSQRLAINPATLSFHLRTLVEAGLVCGVQEGRFVRYTACFGVMHALVDFLTENCCGGGFHACPAPEFHHQPGPPMPAENTPARVLILCTGNSCRSQMAEALINHDLAGQVLARSAGTRPQPRVAEGALAVLEELEIPTDGLTPKDVDAVLEEPFDLVITVCDNARETCPVFPRPVRQVHRAFHDPHGEPIESFRVVRDEIRASLIPLLREELGLIVA